MMDGIEKGEKVDPLGVVVEELLVMFGGSSDEESGFLSFITVFAEPSVIKVRASHEEPGALEQPRTPHSSKGKEVDPFSELKKGSSSGEVCSSSFGCHYFPLIIPSFKAQMSHKEPRTADKTRTSEEARAPELACKPEDTRTP